MKEIRFLKDCPIYDKPAGVRISEVHENTIWNVLQESSYGWLRIVPGWVNFYWPSVQVFVQLTEETPQTPYQADSASVQPTAVTAEDILKLIRLHNLMVETINRIGANIEIGVSQACEGIEIVNIARRLGIDATINMQNGEIILKGAINDSLHC